MSNLQNPPRLTVKPGVNVFTGLAAISCLATLAALIYAIMQYLNMQG